MTSAYDLVILGSGTTAFAGALRAADLGARVLLVEQSQLGGTCVNWGCIPSKTLIDKAEAYFALRSGKVCGLGPTVDAPDFARLASARKLAVETLRREKYQKVLEARPEIDILRGHGRFLSARELRVGAEILQSERFLIACGGYPRSLRLPGLERAEYLNSFSALHLQTFPDSLTIIGGGVIALEMGQMFSRFGTRVTIVERGERPLKDFDRRLTDLFTDLAEQEGMTFILGADPLEVFREQELTCLRVMAGREELTVRSRQLMLAVGTAPATAGIGLEAAGVATDAAGFILTDEKMATSAAGIWAAGDVTGPPLTAPAGAREAEAAVANMFQSEAPCRVDRTVMPMAVFTDPEFALVGLSAEQAESRGLDPAETFLPLAEVAKAHVMDRQQGGVLLCADRASGKVLGAQILAPRAADVIHEAVLAVRFGLTVADLAGTVHVYPTISDGLRLAALEHLARWPQKGP